MHAAVVVMFRLLFRAPPRLISGLPRRSEMAQPMAGSTSNLPWLIQRWGRAAAAIVAIIVAYLLTRHLPNYLNLLIPYDIGVGVYLALFAVVMHRASPEDTAKLARRDEPSSAPVLIVVLAVSVFSLVAVAAMLNHSPGRPGWEVNLHMASSLLAVILSWFLSHVYFGLYYMRIYYEGTVGDARVINHQGLEFPETEMADFRDFMYYSFTIAMCYSTSDVSVTSVRIHRVTLLHAIFSSLFSTVIVGFVVNIISNLA
ncbi:MAG: DUF1345 domain-containing protein [Acetobacteraceae bacterium]|nr:DUF1345 domain-containing protein [Acetobacteraceae bacterium]